MSTAEFLKLNEFLNSFPHEEAIFFGGSFNPWHAGHKECLKLCPFPEKIIIIPDHNPQKELHTFLSPETTLQNLKAETSGLCWGIFDGFMTLKSKNPTYFWLYHLHQKRPHLKLSLLLGADSFLSLQTWVEALQLLKLVTHLYVVPRQTELEKLRSMKQQLEKINPQIKISLLPSHQHEALSSTVLREDNLKK